MTGDTPSINRHTLANGLRIVHSPDTTTAMVCVNMLYNVGARDENRHLTGMAHLFEHLMFGGSANVPDFDACLENAGGHSNAWTSNDFTNFYLSIPAQNIETAFFLESDRMRDLSLTCRSLEVQKGVVIEEFKQQCLDRPYGKLMHVLRDAVYTPSHPYSWPVIGLEPEHIARVTLEDARQWFFSHYAPNNAIMVVCGNVGFDHAVRLAEKWFSDIAPRDIAPRRMPKPVFRSADTTITVKGIAPSPTVTVGIPMDAYGTDGYYAADAITDILSAGRASRFLSQLVYGSGRGLISAADASIIGSEHEGMLLMTSRLTSSDEADLKKARDLMYAQVRQLTAPDNISSREWQRVSNNFESTLRFGNVNFMARAANIAMAEYHDENLATPIEKRRSLSPGDVARHADILFNQTPSVTVNYMSDN